MTKIQPTSTEPASPNGNQSIREADPFDPAALRVSIPADVEVERVLTSVPVRKPKRDEFFRVHPDYVVDTVVLERDTGLEKETYVVAPEVAHLVLPELRRTRLFVAITKRGTVFIWPVKLPADDGDRIRRVSETALLCAEEAKTLWVRVRWDRDLGGYEMLRAKGDLGEPQWPERSFRDLLEIAFRHNRIDREDHPVIKELAGEL